MSIPRIRMVSRSRLYQNSHVLLSSALYERSCPRLSSFLSDTNNDGYDDKKNNNSNTMRRMAVVRYDNNCATVPYIGTYDKARALKARMESNTHKHHIFLLETSKASVPLGPYSSLDDVKTALGGGQQHQHDVEPSSPKYRPRNDGVDS